MSDVRVAAWPVGARTQRTSARPRHQSVYVSSMSIVMCGVCPLVLSPSVRGHLPFRRHLVTSPICINQPRAASARGKITVDQATKLQLLLTVPMTGRRRLIRRTCSLTIGWGSGIMCALLSAL